MVQVAGYCLSVFIGFSLGLIGGGGAILTIPVLVLFFNIDPVPATTYSLFIVGITAISGSINHYRVRNIDYKAVFLFGIPSVIVLFIMRRWLLELIPSTIFRSERVGTFEVPFHPDHIFGRDVDSRLVNDQEKKLCPIKRKAKLFPAYHRRMYYRCYNRIHRHWGRFYYCPFPCFICRFAHEKSDRHQPHYHHY